MSKKALKGPVWLFGRAVAKDDWETAQSYVREVEVVLERKIRKYVKNRDKATIFKKLGMHYLRMKRGNSGRGKNYAPERAAWCNEMLAETLIGEKKYKEAGNAYSIAGIIWATRVNPRNFIESIKCHKSAISCYVKKGDYENAILGISNLIKSTNAAGIGGIVVNDVCVLVQNGEYRKLGNVLIGDIGVKREDAKNIVEKMESGDMPPREFAGRIKEFFRGKR